MMYYMNENVSGYLPENDPQEYSTLAELKSALRERKKELLEYYEYPVLDSWESIGKIKASQFKWAKAWQEKHGLKPEINQITFFGVYEKNSFQLPIYVFAWWES